MINLRNINYFEITSVKESFFRIFGVCIILAIPILGFNWVVMRDTSFDISVLCTQIAVVIPISLLLAWFYVRRVLKAAIIEVGGWLEFQSMKYTDQVKIMKRLESEKIR